MHEATINNGVILEDYLVAVTAFQALLIAVALVGTILHLLEVPDHTELAHSCNQMTLLLPILCHLNNIEQSFSIFTHPYNLNYKNTHSYESENSCTVHRETHIQAMLRKVPSFSSAKCRHKTLGHATQIRTR